MVPTQLQNRFTAWREMTLVTPLKWTIPRWAYLQLDLTFRCLSILGILTLPMFAVGLRSFAIALSFLAVPVLVVSLLLFFGVTLMMAARNAILVARYFSAPTHEAE